MLAVANGRLIAQLIPGARLEILRGRRPHVLVGAARAQRGSCGARARATGDARRRADLVQRGGQPAARVARERVLDAELVEHADDRRGAGRPCGRRRCGMRVDAAGRAPRSRLAGVERGERLARASGSSPARAGCARRGPRPGRRRRRCRAPASASSRRRAASRIRASGTAASARPGSSSSARRSDASSPARDERVGLATGTSPSKKRSTIAAAAARRRTRRRRWPSLNALTAGMPWMPKACASRGLASVSSLARTTSPSRLAAACSSSGPSCAARPAPLGPEVDDDRDARASAR